MCLDENSLDRFSVEDTYIEDQNWYFLKARMDQEGYQEQINAVAEKSAPCGLRSRVKKKYSFRLELAKRSTTLCLVLAVVNSTPISISVMPPFVCRFFGISPLLSPQSPEFQSLALLVCLLLRRCILS